MPVLDHEVHPSTRLDTASRYGCYNHIRRESYAAFDRRYNVWADNFKHDTILVENRMSRECRYDKSLGDQQCDGCRHRGNGEQYADGVRSQGA